MCRPPPSSVVLDQHPSHPLRPAEIIPSSTLTLFISENTAPLPLPLHVLSHHRITLSTWLTKSWTDPISYSIPDPKLSPYSLNQSPEKSLCPWLLLWTFPKWGCPRGHSSSRSSFQGRICITALPFSLKPFLFRDSYRNPSPQSEKTIAHRSLYPPPKKKPFLHTFINAGVFNIHINDLCNTLVCSFIEILPFSFTQLQPLVPLAISELSASSLTACFLWYQLQASPSPPPHLPSFLFTLFWHFALLFLPFPLQVTFHSAILTTYPALTLNSHIALSPSTMSGNSPILVLINSLCTFPPGPEGLKSARKDTICLVSL